MLVKYQSLIRAALLAVLALPTSGTFSVLAFAEELSQGEVSELEKRVRDRWTSISNGDYVDAYEFSTPVYRSVFPKDLYVLQFSYAVERELTEIEVVNYDADAAVASVMVRVMSKPVKQTSAASQAVGAVPVLMTERWMLIDDQWWFSARP